MNHEPFADPNRNYEILETIIKECKEKHLPIKTVKFDKYKHKKSNWITPGIIKSIQYRDKLYMNLKKTPFSSTQHAILKQNLKTYNTILNKLIMNAKKDYYHNEFSRYKGDIKKTWSTINNLLCQPCRPIGTNKGVNC